MADTSTGVPSAEVAFDCDVLDSDEASLVVKQRLGQIIYVQVLSGSLPSYLSNVLVHSYGSWPHHTLIGRPAAGAFRPTPAELSVPAGRTYTVTVLASLSPLGKIRPYLREALDPPARLAPTAVPVAVEGFPYGYGFRTLAGRLRVAPGSSTESDLEARLTDMRQLQTEAIFRAMAIRRQVAQSKPGVAIDLLLGALEDEAEHVRGMAAYDLRPFAARLPLAPFLAAIEDKRVPNAAACLAAAYVFAAHPDEVPIEALLDLYHHMSLGVERPIIQAVVVSAMGRLGERTTAEVTELLTDIVHGSGPVQDVRVREQASIALRGHGLP